MVDFSLVVFVEAQVVRLNDLDRDLVTSADDMTFESFAKCSSADVATDADAVVTEDGVADLIQREFGTKQSSDFRDFDSLKCNQQRPHGQKEEHTSSRLSSLAVTQVSDKDVSI